MIDHKDARKLKGLLSAVLTEMKAQNNVAPSYSPGFLSFEEDMLQLQEFIEDVGEYGLGFENMIADLKAYPFVLSGKAAIALLEAAQLLSYPKTIGTKQ